MLIESGTGNGKLAGIDEDNRLLTASFNIPFEHLIAKDYQKTFSVVGTTATMQAGGNSVLYVENDNENSTIVLTRLIMQTVGATLGGSDYFSLEISSEYDAGGTATDIINLSSGSSVTSGCRAFEGDFTLTGAPTVADVIYPQADKAVIDLEIRGGVLVLPGKGVSVGYNATNTAGFAKCSAYFAVVSNDGYSG